MSPHESLHNNDERTGTPTPRAEHAGFQDHLAETDINEQHSLHPQDEAALEALVSSHYRVEEVGPEQRPIAQGLMSLMSLLDRGSELRGQRESDATLVDLTMARVAQSRRSAGRAGAELSLSGDDDDAVEALIAAGYDVDRVPASLRYRAKRVANLLGLLESGIAPASSSLAGETSLVDTTLARVQRAIDEHEDRLTLSTLGSESLSDESRRGLSLRATDLVSAAALLFIGVMLIAPMATGMRALNRQQACASNMQAAGLAFGAYGNDFGSLMPVASAARSGTRWWNVGNVEQSNSANLFVLFRQEYTATLDHLTCGGNEHAPREATRDWVDWHSLSEVSYSYQCQFADRRPNWSTGGRAGGRVVVLADASPVVRRAVRREVILPFENSPNHDGRGQNVLFNDGSGMWLTTPNVPMGRGDNIWLPRNIEAEIARMSRSAATDPIEGTEEPEREDDSFVGP